MDRSPRGYQSPRRNVGNFNDKPFFPYSDTSSKYQNRLLPDISTDESQDIVLHLSDSHSDNVSSFKYYKEQAQKNLRVSKLIVISDSSESSSPEKIERRVYHYNYSDKNHHRSDSIMIEESSSSDESNSDNERIQFSDGNDKIISETPPGLARRIASSNETICTTESDKSSHNSIDNSHVSPTPQRDEFNDVFSKYNPETRSRYFVDDTSSNIIHRKYLNYKIIRPKRPFYFTDMKKATESTDSRADTKGSGSSEDHEEVLVEKIPEKVDDMPDDVSHITATPPDHSKKLMEKSVEEAEVVPITLSERKKKEIANWILKNNSPESRSSSSCSNERLNISSGNSSLERLELRHETPNNRQKIRQQNNSERKANEGQKSKGQQVMDRYLKKVKPTELKTPLRDKTASTVNPSTNEKNLDILDCADVLDNLYGSDWRKNADVLLQSSEPRKKQQISRIDRAVQTEKKKVPKSKYQTYMIHGSDSESDDENLNLILQSKKTVTDKKKQKPAKLIDSFIDDRNSSDISGDSIYHTAVTNLRPSSDGPGQKKSALPDKVKRILNEICDSETEKSEDAKKVTKNKPVNRRRLLFTDDDTEGSTSEFDPDDQVLPKIMPKKDFSKVSHHAPKITLKTKTSNFEPRGVKSFLASLSSNVSMSETHLDAKIYKIDFKNTKEELSRKLFRLYNECVFDNKLPDDMPIEWSTRMTGTAGFCFNKRAIKQSGGIVRSSRIQLASKIIDTADRLRDTLLHEMCHAAAWLINDVSDGHGPYWKSWANKAMRAFPELPEIKRCHDYKISTKYTYRCTGCGHSVGRHTKSLDTEKKRCGYCYGKFEVLINKTTKSGTVQAKTVSRSKEPSGFALYVKENYHSIKQNRRSMKHGEVMKILGQQFSAIKIAKKHDNVEQSNTCSSDL